MFPPSPGPRWEALQEPTATDSSQDELDLEDDDELSIVPKETATPSDQPLKRKDGGWDIGTAPKRLKLKEPDISDRVGSVSAPVQRVQPTTSNTSSSIAGPSKISNPGTSISARASTSSSMAPPADAFRRIFGEGSLPFTSKPAFRPLTSEQKASISSSSKPSTFDAGPSSQRIKSRLPSNVSSNKLPAPPAKPKPSENEIIEISSDSNDDSPPPPKQQLKPAPKSTGGRQLRRISPPKVKNEPEIIEILDSDDEVAKPQVATGKSVVLGNGLPKDTKVSGDTSTSKPPPEDGMDVDHSSDPPVEVDAPNKSIDIDHPMPPNRENNVPAATHMIVDLRSTPSPPLKPEPASPVGALSLSLQPEPGPSWIKKPNRQGFNPISIPENITLPPSPPKRRLQTAVKTASGHFKQREISPTTSSASSPTGDSESGKESSNPNSRDSTSDPGPDLTDALGINSTGHSSPEPQVVARKSPTPPKVIKPPEPPKAGGTVAKYVARKSTGKSFSPAPPMATKPPRPPNAGGLATKPVARKSSGNMQSLAEAIMKSGQSNAMNAKMHIKRSSKGKNAASLDPTRVVSPATAESSKALVKLFSTLKSKPSTPVASTSKVLPPPLSRSVTNDEHLMPLEPLPPLPPPTPSPPPSNSPLPPATSTSAPTSVPPKLNLNATQKSASSFTTNPSNQPTKPPIPPTTLTWKTGVPFKSKTASKPPTRTSSLSSLPTIAQAGSVGVPEKSPEDPQLLPVRSVDQPAPSPPPEVQQLAVPTRDSPQPSTSKPRISPSFDATFPPDKISDPKSASETQDKQLAVQIEQTTMTSVAVTVSNLIEASKDAPAVPDVEMSWNPPSDEEMNNDTDECQALIEFHDEDDIMEIEHMSQDIPLAKGASPPQSDSNGSNEAGPSRGRSSSPPIELRRSSRRSSRSSIEHWPRTFDDDDNEPPQVYEPASRNTTPEDTGGAGAVVHKGKTYGGLPAITWKEYRRNLNNFVQKCYYAKDLPHALQDHVNDMSPYTQLMSGMRDLFQAMVLENTVEDEPDAPPIEIQNGVDEEPTPPWEFYYTNKMWHGEGVPPPDVKNLISCSCKGVCDPRSKTCACLMNQRKVAADPYLEFAYDKAGRLKIPGYPVFECNDLCGCGDECRNRVVQHGRKVQVSIRKTEHKGWGVFAGNKKIPMGTFIGIYSGELLTDTVAHERGVLYNTYGRTYLFDLDFHHLKPDENDENYHDWSNKYTVDAYHAGNFTRFLNNSCDPNCRLYPCYINEGNIDKPLLTIFSRRDIEPNEEICFNYQGRYPGDEGDDDENPEGDTDADDESQGGARDRIYEKCMCGAANCTGVMFR